MNYAICRIVGNELPPRDALGTKLRSVEHIVKNEVLPAHPVWVLNQILDDGYKSEIKKVLSGQEVHELPFKPAIFFRAKTREEKIRIAVNINAARNFGFSVCRDRFRFTAVLDQDCYFWPDEWEKITTFIDEDQKSADRKHYCCPSKRVMGTKMPKSLDEIRPEEAMVIFRNDADRLFDPDIRFGDGEKMRLLNALGVTVNVRDRRVSVAGEKTRIPGYVTHVAFGEELIESDVGVRINRRTQSLDRLLAGIEDKYKVKML